MIWTTLIGFSSPYLGTIWTQSGTVPGKIYYFRISAQNDHGWSPFSDVKPILAANVPNKVGMALVNPESAVSTNVLITWTAPTANGSPIESYEVQLKASNGNFMTLESICDGDSAEALATLSCTFPIADVMLAPLSL